MLVNNTLHDVILLLNKWSDSDLTLTIFIGPGCGVIQPLLLCLKPNFAGPSEQIGTGHYHALQWYFQSKTGNNQCFSTCNSSVGYMVRLHI